MDQIHAVTTPGNRMQGRYVRCQLETVLNALHLCTPLLAILVAWQCSKKRIDVVRLLMQIRQLNATNCLPQPLQGYQANGQQIEEGTAADFHNLDGICSVY